MSPSAMFSSPLTYEYIDDRATFVEVCQQLSKCPALGFDLEGEFNLHRFGMHLCLIQIHNGSDQIFLIDPLQVGPLDPLLELLESPDVTLIAHGSPGDWVLLDYLYGCRPRNIFDTQIAASLVGTAQTSLGALLEQYFGAEKNSKLSRSNWNQRPLSDQMLQYAALDVAYLHPLKDKLELELQQMNRTSWHQEECLALEDVRYRPKENPHMRLKGAQRLSVEEQHVLRHLFDVRDKIAQTLDKPAHFIINNPKLLDLAQYPPKSSQAWAQLRGVHHRVRDEANNFHKAVTLAQSTRPPAPDPSSRMNDMGILISPEDMEQLRNKIELDYSDISNLILPNGKRNRLNLDDMKDWKRSIIEQTAKELSIPLEGG